MYNIAIIGAGMSGLIAGIYLKSNNTNIDIYERQDKAGKKILLTGNGKCNITNSYLDKDCYNNNARNFIERLYKKFDTNFVLNIYNSLGILTKNRNGYYYPVSNQAKTIVNTLISENKSLNNNFIFNSYIDEISCNNKQYIINSKTYDFVIFSCGGMSGIYRENEFNGYKSLRKLGLKLNRSYPALTRIMVNEPLLKYANGVRLDATISLYCNDNFILKEEGELQFSENKISGIAAFQLTLDLASFLDKYNKSNENNYAFLIIDSIPSVSSDEIIELFNNSKDNESIISFLSKITNDKYADFIINKLNLNKELLISKLKYETVIKIVSALKELKLDISGLDNFKNAQVSAGGVSLDEISDDFQSVKFPNIYIVGEMLDVTGKCGGYNLHFALTSGYAAAKHILSRIN